MLKPLAEQVAELERERDALRGQLEASEQHVRIRGENLDRFGEEIQSLRKQLASAKVEGARLIAAVRSRISYWDASGSRSVTLEFKSEEAAQEFEAAMRAVDPAPASGEGVRSRCGCWADRAPNEPCVCPRLRERWKTPWHCDRCKRGGTGAAVCGEQKCNATRNAFPATPPSAPELELMLPVVDGVTSYVRISPADARRIVGMAQGGTDGE